MLELKKVTKEFGNVKVVDNISIKVNNGKIFGLIRKKWRSENQLHFE